MEQVVWAGLLLFVLVRFGPQISAWTGITWPSGAAAEITPAVDVVTLEGVPLGPAELEGRIQVITFWATWCSVCALELPSLQRVQEAWADADDVQVLSLSIDQTGPGWVADHVQEKGYTFPVALADPALRRTFGGIPGVPTTFLVDRSGVVRHMLIGLTGPGTLQRAVRRLVEEQEEEQEQDSGTPKSR